MLRTEFVAIDPLAAGLGVAGMQVQAMLPGNEREHLLDIAAKFIGRAGLAGIVAGDGQAAAEFLSHVLKAANVVPLPTVQRNGNIRQLRHRLFGIHTQFGIADLLRQFTAPDILRLGRQVPPL